MLAIGLECGEYVLAVVTCQLEGEPSMAAERVARLEKTFGDICELPHDALVVAGDFNAPLVENGWRNSALSSFMRMGMVPCGTTEWQLEVAPFMSQVSHRYASEPVYCLPFGQAIRHMDMVDNIWHSDGLCLTSVRDPFFDQAFRTNAFAHGLPNLQNPSDHLPLGASFLWR